MGEGLEGGSFMRRREINSLATSDAAGEPSPRYGESLAKALTIAAQEAEKTPYHDLPIERIDPVRRIIDDRNQGNTE